jgi:hypothetical protein
MQNDVILRCFAVALAAAAFGCGDDGLDASWSTSQILQPVNGPPAYPVGPYGTTKGTIVAQYQFVGYQNAQTQHSSTQAIQLADFYNPHVNDSGYAPADPSQDDRLFPAGSLYGSSAPKPRALSITISSGWCGPCRNEAKTVIPAKRLQYKPMGGEFLVQLNDGTMQGHSATQQDLLNWTTQFHVDYPATIDPSRQLDALFVQHAYPTNIILDTRSMDIVEVVAGVPGDAYWTKFENTLNAP